MGSGCSGCRGGAEPTFVAVDAAEAWIARTGEVSAGLADAAPPRAAHVRGDVPHSGRVVGRHGNGAAVDGCETTKSHFISRGDGLALRPSENSVCVFGGGCHLGRGGSGSSL